MILSESKKYKQHIFVFIKFELVSFFAVSGWLRAKLKLRESFVNVFKFYRYFISLIIFAVFLLIGCYGFTSTAQNNKIFNYDAARDKNAVKKMFHDDWQLLYYGDWDKITINDFDVDFMLDNRSSSQHVAQHNLILKVVRDADKTVGFLAYYPKSLYWWHMLFLIVDKDYRGKGYAAKMMKFMIDDMIARGALKITTFTRLINTPARALYEGKFKFKDIGHPDDKYLDLVLYPSKK